MDRPVLDEDLNEVQTLSQLLGGPLHRYHDEALARGVPHGDVHRYMIIALSRVCGILAVRMGNTPEQFGKSMEAVGVAAEIELTMYGFDAETISPLVNCRTKGES